MYSADGEKLYVREIPASGTAKGTEYAANYRIENGAITMIHTDAGYYTRILTPVGVTGPLYTHIWYLRDHLGNNRVLADDGGNAIALHDYDPYGEEISVAFSSLLYPFPPGGRESPYKYGGKEWTSTTSTYDFEARQLAPSFHRFTTMDPLAEKYYSISPYAYCAGNPVNRVDPDGLIDKEWLKKGGATFGAGMVATIGGGIAVSSGVGAAFGAYAISTGIPAIGLGLGMLVVGLFTDPTPEGREALERMPTGLMNAIGKASDIAFETGNHEIERTANLVDAMIGLGTLSQPNSVIEIVINGATLTQAGIALGGILELAEENVHSSNSQPPQSVTPDYSVANWQEDLQNNSLWKPLE